MDVTTHVLIGIITALAAYIAKSLHSLTGSVNELNNKLAVLLAKTNYHESELKDLEQRLAAVEGAPPLFDWICDLLVKRRLSSILAAKLLRQLHQS